MLSTASSCLTAKTLACPWRRLRSGCRCRSSSTPPTPHTQLATASWCGNMQSKARICIFDAVLSVLALVCRSWRPARRPCGSCSRTPPRTSSGRPRRSVHRPCAALSRTQLTLAPLSRNQGLELACAGLAHPAPAVRAATLHIVHTRVARDSFAVEPPARREVRLVGGAPPSCPAHSPPPPLRAPAGTGRRAVRCHDDVGGRGGATEH